MILHFKQDTVTPNIMCLTKSVALNLPYSGRTVIEAPFYFNGHSTPTVFSTLVPKHLCKLPALFHDKLCENAKCNADRKNADLDYAWIFRTYYPQYKGRRRWGTLGVTLGRYWWRISGHYK